MKLDVASPCSESWDGMAGDERVRFCAKCRLNVYNLSEMAPPEIEQIFAREGKPPCVRFYARPDGTVLTQDCPVGRRRAWFIRSMWAAAALVLAGFVFIVLNETRHDGRTFVDWVKELIDQLNPRPPVLMGKPAPPPPPGW